MADEDKQQAPEPLSPEMLKRAMTAFKKRLKLTRLDEDSRLGRGPFSGGSLGVYAIQPPAEFPGLGRIVPTGQTPPQRPRHVRTTKPQR